MNGHTVLLGLALLLSLFATFGVESKINLFAAAFACYVASLLF